MGHLTENEKQAIEFLIPGIFESYESLKKDNPYGLYTSSGSFYNHAIFARDVASAARFVGSFEHDTAKSILKTLIAYQGVGVNKRTQEQPGRIHHEYRDFSKWHGRFSEKLILRLVGLFWGGRNGRLLTYYATDSTASYIRAVYRFASKIDNAFLDNEYPNKFGQPTTVQNSIEQAAQWIMSNVDSAGRFVAGRSSWSLPYQTFQDSVTAYCWADGRPVNYNKPHSFLEAQSFNASALENISKLLAGRSENVNAYKECAHHMRRALIRDYWDSSYNFFTSALSERDGVMRPLDVPNISAGWVLNASWWSEVPTQERREKVSSVVNRLFSEEFMTSVGLRTKSKYAKEPLVGVVDYHGSQTVWPMFNYMVIEGLRRHRLYRLAEQLENRVVNGINAIQKFAEFMVVDKDGTFYHPTKNKALDHLPVQMIPERDIAFTVVPLLSIARHRLAELEELTPLPWQSELEKDVLRRLKVVELHKPVESRNYLKPQKIFLTRAGATLRSISHIIRSSD